MENKKENKLAVIYARVSSEKQEKEGTIESQIAELKKSIVENGDVFVQTYADDGYSGELLARPALDQLRTDAEKGLFQKVYFLSPDRLARKSIYAAVILEDLRKHGIEVFFANRPLSDTPEDNLLFGIQNAVADYEKAKILDRMRRGKKFKISRGVVIGNTPPYGYRYVKQEKSKDGRYEINNEEAEIVRLVFSLYTDGSYSGIGGVRRELHERGIKNRSGSTKWAQSMIARIISNETYIGLTHWGKFKSVEGKDDGTYRRLKNTKRIKRAKEEWYGIPVPAIITEDVFKMAETRRKTNKSMSPKCVKNDYLLRGMMKHSCGAAMYSKHCHGHKYYVCSSKRNIFPDQEPCQNSRHYNGKYIESGVWGKFREVLLSPRMLLRFIERRSTLKGSIKEKTEIRIVEIDKLTEIKKEKNSRLIGAYSDGIISLEELKNQKGEIQESLEKLNLERKGLLEKVGFQETEVPSVINLENFSQGIKTVLEKVDEKKKRNILQYFINQIVLDGDKAMVLAVLPKELLVAPTATPF